MYSNYFDDLTCWLSGEPFLPFWLLNYYHVWCKFWVTFVPRCFCHEDTVRNEPEKAPFMCLFSKLFLWETGLAPNLHDGRVCPHPYPPPLAVEGAPCSHFVIGLLPFSIPNWRKATVQGMVKYMSQVTHK